MFLCFSKLQESSYCKEGQGWFAGLEKPFDKAFDLFFVPIYSEGGFDMTDLAKLLSKAEVSVSLA